MAWLDALWLAAGAVPGACAGAFSFRYISSKVITIVLYAVVFLSAIFNIYRLWQARAEKQKGDEQDEGSGEDVQPHDSAAELEAEPKPGEDGQHAPEAASRDDSQRDGQAGGMVVTYKAPSQNSRTNSDARCGRGGDLDASSGSLAADDAGEVKVELSAPDRNAEDGANVELSAPGRNAEDGANVELSGPPSPDCNAEDGANVELSAPDRNAEDGANVELSAPDRNAEDGAKVELSGPPSPDRNAEDGSSTRWTANTKR
jgi:hypothetical protein